ncbi:hypothetical protein CSR02_05985 [Acetobacter pomorum]|uniref:Hedgehog/Intein (Hint) domain-containing protein n=1 Tax=Acetobacter pomorum TaxID=65959 RepID=A0A2G4RD57_9PROT|nr:Hint domain-containing protein [Acetobacter pomorum]PHY94477.1 hypothetical protein CSR02_05985 [Acetobacter pomorum]GBR52412.1 hypothetical protein AA11825_2232 [Acetobacter pomorum DSM 11825]
MPTVEKTTVDTNKTVVFDAADSARHSNVDFTGTGGNLEIQNLSPHHPIALTVSGNFGKNISNVLTFSAQDHLSTSKSTVSYNKFTKTTVITLENAHGKFLGTITLHGNVYDLGGWHHHGTTVPLSRIASFNHNHQATVCFLADSQISTPTGTVAVQDLRAGDEVLVHNNAGTQPAALIWAGKAQCTVNPALPDDMAGWPVRIVENAIAPGVPNQDLLITAEHCLFLNGGFVPVRMLVNGVSIFYDKSISSYEYYHIEAPNHAVIMANGVLTESYLDTGNRSSFVSDGNVVRIGEIPKSWQEDAAAPLYVARDKVEPLFKQIMARLPEGARKPAAETTQAPQLRLKTASGATIWPANSQNNTYNFILPPHTQSVHLLSRTSRPADIIGPYVDDRRNLGVAVADITLLSGRKRHAITAHLQAEKPEGWYETEQTITAKTA